MVKPIVSLLKRLRNYIVARMHIGHLHPGDQLPSYRELSERWDIDHRMIARAYRALETEGMVEVRGRSGVFLKEQERIGGEMLSETARWVAREVLTEAWQRRIKIPKLPRFIHRCTASVKLQTACIESNEDHRDLLCRELHEWFGFETKGVPVDRLPEHDPDSSVHVVPIDELPEAVRTADLLVTTSFHAHQVRPIAEVLQKPYVVVAMHPVAAEIFLDRLREGPLTVVCIDPRFGARMKSVAGPEYEDRIQVVLATDKKGIKELDPDQPMFISTAAQAQIDRPPSSIIMKDVPAFSPESAAELALLLIRLNIEGAGASK
jgi:DNA-binding transcriptional regulator YhcF (GntR family)